jgi:hypothetical protein
VLTTGKVAAEPAAACQASWPGPAALRGSRMGENCIVFLTDGVAFGSGCTIAASTIPWSPFRPWLPWSCIPRNRAQPPRSTGKATTTPAASVTHVIHSEAPMPVYTPQAVTGRGDLPGQAGNTSDYHQNRRPGAVARLCGFAITANLSTSQDAPHVPPTSAVGALTGIPPEIPVKNLINLLPSKLVYLIRQHNRKSLMVVVASTDARTRLPL